MHTLFFGLQATLQKIIEFFNSANTPESGPVTPRQGTTTAEVVSTAKPAVNDLLRQITQIDPKYMRPLEFVPPPDFVPPTSKPAGTGRSLGPPPGFEHVVPKPPGVCNPKFKGPPPAKHQTSDLKVKGPPPAKPPGLDRAFPDVHKGQNS